MYRTTLVAIPGGICLHTLNTMYGTALVEFLGASVCTPFISSFFRGSKVGNHDGSWLPTSLLPTALAFCPEGFLLWLGETFWGVCKLQRSRELTSGQPAVFGWWRTDPVGNSPPAPNCIEHSCLEGPRKIGCRCPERWPPTALFFPLLSGAAFSKWTTNQQTHISLLGKLKLRHAIRFQIIVKTQLISRVWGLIPVILAVKRWRQEVSEFKVSLSYIQSLKPAWVI